MNTDLINLLKNHIVSVILKSGAVIHCTQLSEYMPPNQTGQVLLQERLDSNELGNTIKVYDTTHNRFRYLDLSDVDKYLL